MKRLALMMAVVVAALAAASPAYGQGAVVDAYGGDSGGVLGTVQGGDGGNGGQGVAGTGGGGVPEQPVAAAQGGSLPFTGLDLGLLVAGGIVLLGMGVGLRRLARPLS